MERILKVYLMIDNRILTKMIFLDFNIFYLFLVHSVDFFYIYNLMKLYYRNLTIDSFIKLFFFHKNIKSFQLNSFNNLLLTFSEYIIKQIN